jgi:hypothetical protein
MSISGSLEGQVLSTDVWRAWLPVLNQSVAVRGILYWRREEAPIGADRGPSPSDRGVAWVIEADGTERSINNGDVITRAEAVRLAAAGEYTPDAEP